MENEIKVVFNGIKLNGKLEKAMISPYFEKGELKYISVYKDGCYRFSDGIHSIFKVKNNSDTLTDYFEKDSIRIEKDNQYFKDFVKAALISRQRNLNSYKKRIEKGTVKLTDYAKSSINHAENEINYLSTI